MKKLLSILLCATLILSFAGCGTKEKKSTPEALSVKPDSSGILTEAKYPKQTKYPSENSDDMTLFEKWAAERQAKNALNPGITDKTSNCFSRLTQEFLKSNDGKNSVLSPISLYMALALTGEITDGDTRAEILDLLGADDISSLRESASLIWQKCYSDDGITTCNLANSIWMRDDASYKQDALNNLSKYYYSSAYCGKMGSEQYNKKLANWINENTQNKLTDFTSDFKLNSGTFLALINTLYFKSSWENEFSEGLTKDREFTKTSGDKITCPFMNKNSQLFYVEGDRFTAVAIPLSDNAAMWTLLPDEGVTPDELLTDKTAQELMQSGKTDSSEIKTVNLSIPKFDVSATTDLIDGLNALGIKKLCSPDPDFTPITDSPLILSRALQNARVTVDEKGCTAAAVTIMTTKSTGIIMPEKIIDFTLDRPFVFSIVYGEMPMFSGIVNQPE